MTDENGFAALMERYQFSAEVGGLIGLLIGDACGVSFEFCPADQIPPRDQIDMVPPVGFPRSHPSVPVGTWSDDSAQALCLLASLVDCGEFSLPDFAERLLQWMEWGYMAVDGAVFDVGNQTREALDRLREGVPPDESGGETVLDNGNGSLMRVLPLALWHSGTDEALVHDAHLQSVPTHRHPRSMVACAYYCLVARAYLAKVSEPWWWADHRLERIYSDWRDQPLRDSFLFELDVLRRFPVTNKPRGTGYVLDTIWSARRALEEASFEDVVRTAIMFGNDTDTTSAVSAGLAGIRFGLEGIPARWLRQLRGVELIKPLVDRFSNQRN
ncbi:ADP-ribosylglycohydrolase family protein [Pandoraea terrae]|uniref:ADP-ribosylglycohydrolase family protein n=1 Tax=Pandoraea terrae TaxID=1537710 RepID=UPI001CD767CB|nr:ADP-ribosylglycohydrolase family protein [Pandoraea terrae]